MTPKMFDFTLTFGGRDPFDNFDPAGCQIVESFSAFDNIGPIWCQTVESTSPIRQFWPPR